VVRYGDRVQPSLLSSLDDRAQHGTETRRPALPDRFEDSRVRASIQVPGLKTMSHRANTKIASTSP
jgi:hypothetical protein